MFNHMIHLLDFVQLYLVDYLNPSLILQDYREFKIRHTWSVVNFELEKHLKKSSEKEKVVLQKELIQTTTW